MAHSVNSILRTNWLQILVLSTVIVFSLNKTALADEKKKSTLRVGIGYTNIGYKVDNMSIEIRDVPIHPDDDYVPRENAGPIEETKYTASSMWTFNLSYKKNFYERLRLGAGLKWIIYPTRKLYDNKLRNYTNAVGTEKRGTGTALTFLGLEARGVIPATDVEILDIFLNIIPELLAEYALDKDKNFFIGTSLTYFKMQAVNGWDRFDDLEVDKRHTLTHVIPISLYLSWKDILLIGGKYNVSFNTEQGKDSDANIEDINIFVSLSFGF